MLGIVLDRNIEVQLWRQIYQSLKKVILCGQLKAGEPLPSTRELSKELNVSRNTICVAYDLLISEGFTISRQGAPTRVAEGLCLEPVSEPFLHKKVTKPDYQISVSFRTGKPELRHFPRFLWQQLINQSVDKLPLKSFDYSDPQGLSELRDEISAWLFRSRGLRVSSEDIFITAGATQGLHILADILCRKNNTVLMEDPCHMGMLGTFLNKGCSFIPIPVDEHGMRTDFLYDCGQKGPVYVTPSHQFPLGGILPASRRAALIRFARENEVYIVEDDYDSEFRYSGEPVAPLYSMSPERVIYVGTFSKTVFPALRIGFVILPLSLQALWRTLRTYTDVQNPPFEQAALAEFLRTRKFDRHVQKMRKLYNQRRDVLMDSLADAFGNDWLPCGDAAGLHVAIDFAGRRFDDAFNKKCLQSGLFIKPLESYCIEKGRYLSKLLIGYGHLEPKEIRQGVILLSKIMNRPD